MAQSVLILGGGIIGLSCALEATGLGFRVTVVEESGFGGQATGAAAGMLAPFSENPDGFDPFFRLCLDSFMQYPEWVREIEEISGERVELSASGSLNVAFHEADMLPMQTRLQWQRPYCAQMEWLDESRLHSVEPRISRKAIGALYCPAESHVFAPKLAIAAEEACRRAGVRLVPHAGPLSKLEVTKASGVSVTMGDAQTWRADRLVVCTGAWSGFLQEWIRVGVPVHPIRGQICAYDAGLGEVRHMVFSSQAYWVRKDDGTIVCGASEDVAGFDRSVTAQGIERLTRWSGRVFSFLEGKTPVRSWAGLRPATLDGRPLIGEVPGCPEVIVAAGHYRNGILLSPATASMVGRLLLAKTDSQGNAFSLERFNRTAEKERSR
ncbi:glycine oxidase ThiO [Cohnella panacarvi]|uniref:glycine oxidase ThiO n=1 Tax=Cohnella panacarvi TaxID=400776 RepID=UPI00047B389F|nr:glycine oxidase ThiO [Cohnella panacarvi]